MAKESNQKPRAAAPTAAARAILDAAQGLAQTRGYNGFSYADVAAQLGVTKASLHYALYDTVLQNDRMCLCGMLAAEYATLPESMQTQLHLFFDANERWLATVLEEGCRVGRFAFKERPNERARVLLGALEGAMLMARSYGDPRRFRVAAGYVLADLCKSALRAVRVNPAQRRARAR